eukprot:CAMPEP_0181368544 /NCGR_PEP_ID=MMETSP1106-20121128/12155_1 /TAXON_ID=81844 /ORGANISM="Mantoniella antarctica, Strain SL-175" /LENGTH=110 /DNA_ID=CAMNT_0023484689 /DNA_START=5 /DNA_END=334 /DNA_ORIENTATION=-
MAQGEVLFKVAGFAVGSEVPPARDSADAAAAAAAAGSRSFMFSPPPPPALAREPSVSKGFNADVPFMPRQPQPQPQHQQQQPKQQQQQQQSGPQQHWQQPTAHDMNASSF